LLSIPKIVGFDIIMRMSKKRLSKKTSKPKIIVLKNKYLFCLQKKLRKNKLFLRLVKFIKELSFSKFKWPLLGLLILLIAIIVFTFSFFQDLPSAKSLNTREISQTTKIYDRSGKILYEIFADQNRTSIPLSKMPPYLKQATLSIEDKDFYRHGGFALRGIIRATREIILNRRLQGGSTITQQLVKGALLSPERTIQRKIKELFLSFWTEKIYTKDQILEMYLNQVPYGGTSWGIEAAAEVYFGKPAEKLDLAESALLAGLPAAPTYYSPYGANPKLAKGRQEEVLRRMHEDGYITKEQEQQAKNEKLKFKTPSITINAPHFVMYVKDQLVKKYGENFIAKGGLKVITTLDLDLQNFSEETIATEVAKMANLKVGNAAALITKPSTGEILTMVGSKDYFDTEHDGNVNVTTSQRSPGSSIKPLNYALGFLRKTVTPATMFLDIPICFPDASGKKYCPGNYDGKFHGPQQVRFALGNSYNIPAVKMLALNGMDDFLSTASAMGITTFVDKSRYGLSLTLGGGEIKMVDMAVAFGVFANAGIRKDLVSILKVMDKNGNILEETKLPKLDENIPSLAIEGKRVLPPDVTYLISHILLDDNARSSTFGSGSLLTIPGHPGVSVKTGTAEDKRDNWTIGYNSSVLTAVWVGNNDNSPMSPYLESGGSGAAPIWHKIMTRVLKDKPDEWPKKPDNIVGAEICFDGKLPDGDNCPGKRFEYFIRGTVPTEKTGNYKQKIFIDKTTQKPVKPGQTDNVEEKEEQLISDPLQKNYCITCPY